MDTQRIEQLLRWHSKVAAEHELPWEIIPYERHRDQRVVYELYSQNSDIMDSVCKQNVEYVCDLRELADAMANAMRELLLQQQLTDLRQSKVAS